MRYFVKKGTMFLDSRSPVQTIAGSSDFMAELPEKRREWSLYLALGQVGLEMVVPIGLGFVLDRWLRTFPGFTAGGVVLGFIVGIVHLLHLLRRLDQSDSHEAKQNDQ